MNTRELKNMIKDSIHMENELYDFCIECLKKIYGDKFACVEYLFEESLESIEYNGCIQSLSCIDQSFQRNEKEREERLKRNKQNNNEDDNS